MLPDATGTKNGVKTNDNFLTPITGASVVGIMLWYAAPMTTANVEFTVVSVTFFGISYTVD